MNALKRGSSAGEVGFVAAAATTHCAQADRLKVAPSCCLPGKQQCYAGMHFNKILQACTTGTAQADVGLFAASMSSGTGEQAPAGCGTNSLRVPDSNSIGVEALKSSKKSGLAGAAFQ